MQRSMSYRKPAPVYIPSPPPSPRASAVPSADEKNGKEIPPLPDNWREIVSSKTLERNISTQPFIEPLTGSNDDQLELDITEQVPVVPEKPKHSTDLISDGEVNSLATLHGHQPSNVRTTRARGLPREFRPPTPPLPSQRPVDTVAENAFPSSTTLPPRNLYPTGSSLNIHNHHHQPVMRGSSMRTTTSFRSEETMGSWNQLSTYRGMGTSTDVTMYSYPTLLMQKRTVNIKMDNTLGESVDQVSCWEAAGGLGALAKKVLDFLVFCK